MYKGFTVLFICFFLIFSSLTNAAIPVNLRLNSFNNIKKQFAVFDKKNANRNSANRNSELFILSKHIDNKNIVHVRMEQQYKGFIVFGGYAILHVKNSENLLSSNKSKMNGTIYKKLDADLGVPTDNFIADGQNALQHFLKSYKNDSTSNGKVIPMVYVDSQNTAHWAYKVSVDIQYANRRPMRPTAILDAQTLKPFVQWDDIKSLNIRDVYGKGFGGNPKIGQYNFGTGDYPLLQLTRDDAKQTCFMENNNVRIVDMHHMNTSDNKAMQFTCLTHDIIEDNVYLTGYNADGYDLENGAYSPSNDALYAGYVVKNIYHDWYGLDALTKYDGSPMQFIMRVHYGNGYENAYWDGKQMTFGDGKNLLYPLVSLGVAAHEISHGFTEQHSDLIYIGQSGGMNESFSDMASQVAEYYSTGKCTWMIGSEITKENSGVEAFRYMDLPSRDGVSIDSADQWEESLNVHHSSGVYNRLFYLLSNQSGWNARKSFEIMIKANLDYWTPFSTFNEGACGIINAAIDLDYSVNHVRKVLDLVAIDYTGCGFF